MSLPVHLADVAGVREGDVVEVTGEEAHHAVVVRRLRVGERVVLVDCVGTAATCEVTSTGKANLTAVVRSVAVVARPAPSLTVVQAIPKGDRGELAVEVLTEVGVEVVVPWSAERCVATWKGERGEKQLARWRSTAREAAKQSRRSWHPTVTTMGATEEVLRLVASADLAVVLHEAGTIPLACLDVPAAGSVVVVVGPEGGLSDDELAGFTAAGARVVRLGDEVLRTSTAGLAAAAVVLSRTPRWSAGAPTAG